MARPIARYAILRSLQGCYMPDSVDYAEFSTRRELANAIRDEIEMANFPANAFAQAMLRRVWGFITRNGSSSMHFQIDHGSYAIEFRGLTEQEFADHSAETFA